MRSILRAPMGVLCLAVLGLAAPWAQAEPPAPGVLRASVQALWLANPQVQAARADLDAARARARAAAQPLYNPSLELGAERADVRRQSIGISLPLDLSGKREARSAVGMADLHIVEATYQQVRRDVAARWLKAWFASALARQQQDLGQRRLALMERFDALAKQRLQVGDISSPERDLAGLALSEAQTQQASLLGAAAAAQASLQALRGTEAVQADDPPALAMLPPLLAVIAPLDEQLPELRAARARADSADAAVTLAWRNRIPDPTIGMVGGTVNGAPSGPNRNYSLIGITVSIPLPIRNSYKAELDAARAEADATAFEVGTQRLAMGARLAEARARYASLRSAGEAFRAGRASAFAERTVLLERLWKSGEIDTSDYLIQLKQSLDTALSGLQLQSDTWQAYVDYQVAAGGLVRWLDGNNQESAR